MKIQTKPPNEMKSKRERTNVETDGSRCDDEQKENWLKQNVDENRFQFSIERNERTRGKERIRFQLETQRVSFRHRREIILLFISWLIKIIMSLRMQRKLKWNWKGYRFTCFQWMNNLRSSLNQPMKSEHKIERKWTLKWTNQRFLHSFCLSQRKKDKIPIPIYSIFNDVDSRVYFFFLLVRRFFVNKRVKMDLTPICSFAFFSFFGTRKSNKIFNFAQRMRTSRTDDVKRNLKNEVRIFRIPSAFLLPYFMIDVIN